MEPRRSTENASSPDAPALRLTSRQWWGVVGFWTLFGVLESGKVYVSARLRGVPAEPGRVLLGNMPWWWMWALLTPLVFRLAGRFRLDRGPMLAAVPLHLAASLLLSAMHLVVVGNLYYVTHASANVPSVAVMLRNWAEAFLMLNMLTYWVIVVAHHGLHYHRRYRDAELEAAGLALRAAHLESSMTEARLNALRMELNPHFLFNTLNAISGLVRARETASAVTMLARLGELLRITLEQSGEQQIPLERELAHLDLYLGIERIRFHDRLTVDIDADAAVLGALVPALVLQPIVENSVRHGVARLSGPGRISIRAFREDGDLVLRVADTGVGFSGAPRRDGVGLANTRARLEQLHGARATLITANDAGGGAVVTIRLPLEEPASLVAAEDVP